LAAFPLSQPIAALSIQPWRKPLGETTFSIGEVMRFYVFSYAIAVRDAAGLLPILPRI
jgi:hypothetical protein